MMFNQNKKKEEFSVHDEHSATIHPAPKVIPDTNAANSMLAKELNETSAAEREKAYEDIHGVAKEIIEEPEFVSKCLNEMQAAVNEIHNKPAYEKALAMSPHYAGGKSTFLMFLRSTDFDAKQAAAKIVKYFEHIQFYFGDEVLGRPILYSDMNKEDLECLKSGWLQPLQFRDKSGRFVACAVVQGTKERNAVSVMKATLYATMSMAYYDEDFQKHGLVTIAINRQSMKLTPKIIDVTWHLAILMSYVPIKLSALHFCIAKARAATPLLSISAFGWGKKNRIRHRVHFGTQTEWLYSLMTFGIPVDSIPLTNSGELKTKYYREWLTQIRTLERGNPQVVTMNNNYNNIIITPRWTDVLGGKGSLAQSYVGNVLFNQAVDEYREEYQKQASKKKKQQIVARIYDLLEKENVRFLERNKDGYWEKVCESEYINNKIMYRLRTKIKTVTPAAKVEHKHDEHNPPPSFLNQTGESGTNNNNNGTCCRPSSVQQDEKDEQGGRNKRQKL